MEEDIHGPGIDAEGAAFPGVNLYVELGHGTDYAWSATSSGQNIIDTFAAPLCNPSGGAVSIDSDYLRAARALRGDADVDRPRVVDAEPRGPDARPARSRFQHAADRIRHRHRTREDPAAEPVAYCNLRSTYMHELDSASGLRACSTTRPRCARRRSSSTAADHDRLHLQLVLCQQRGTSLTSTRVAIPCARPHTDPLFPELSSTLREGPGYRGGAALTPAGLTERRDAAERPSAGRRSSPT